jgi:hypothetical protein
MPSAQSDGTNHQTPDNLDQHHAAAQYDDGPGLALIVVMAFA